VVPLCLWGSLSGVIVGRAVARGRGEGVGDRNSWAVGIRLTSVLLLWRVCGVHGKGGLARGGLGFSREPL